MTDTEGTVPAHLAALVLDHSALAALEDHGALVQVGAGLEVSIETARRVLGDEAADALWAYLRRCRRFWGRVEAGNGGGEAYLRTRRTLLDVSQASGQGRSQDLGAQYDAISAVPVLGDILHDACSEAPDWDQIRNAGAGIGLAVLVSDGRAELRAPLTGRAFDPPLGGAASLGEVRRTLEFTIRHAPWRDRRRRRLGRVTVSVEEIWPEPPGFVPSEHNAAAGTR